MSTSFWKSGHVPTLFAAFLYFDLSFMVWYLLGPLAVQIAADLQLSAQQRGLMVATPILAGAVLRFLMGLLADRTSRTRLMALAETLRALALLLLLGLIVAGQVSIAALAVLGFMAAVGTVAFSVAAPSLVPLLNGRK